jgi:hypothetical protein
MITYVFHVSRSSCVLLGDRDFASSGTQREPKEHFALLCVVFSQGSLTGLVPGMFLDEKGNEVPCPDESRCGLFIQTRQGDQVRASIPPDHCAFQIGETSQIQSGGLLQATPHAVLSSTSSSCGVTRESFAVFLEPEFGDELSIPEGKTVDDCQGHKQGEKLGLRSIRARWNPGQSFGDFHLATVSGFLTERF